MNKELFELIKGNFKTKGQDRFIVGIDGLSRSGKTTLVNQLARMLKKEKIPVHLFHIDDHIVKRSERYDTGNDEWYEYYSLQWDVKRLKEHFFQVLKEANQLTLPFYDGGSDVHEIRDIQLPHTCLIIIEGVFLQRREWRSFFDYMVYLDLPREERFLREREPTQMNTDKFINRYWKAEDYYLENEDPIKQADFVLKV